MRWGRTRTLVPRALPLLEPAHHIARPHYPRPLHGLAASNYASAACPGRPGSPRQRRLLEPGGVVVLSIGVGGGSAAVASTHPVLCLVLHHCAAQPITQKECAFAY